METNQLFSNVIEYLNNLNFDININFKSKEEKYIKKMTNKFFYNLDIKLNEILYDNNKKINPYNLPIIYNTADNLFYGKFNTIFQNDKYIFKNIELNKNITSMTPAIYIHELTHTQVLNHNKLSDIHYELLSVFMDKLYTYYFNEENSFLINQLYRLDILKKALNLYQNYNLNDKQIINTKMIITSLLEVEHLFYNYIDGYQSDKAKIIDQVQYIFDGNISVDEMLDILNVEMYNSSESTYIRSNLKLAKRFSN